MKDEPVKHPVPKPPATAGGAAQQIVTDEPFPAIPLRQTGRRVTTGLIGLGLLFGFSLLGGDARTDWHLALPGPVIGLALLTLVLLLAARWHAWSHRQLTLHLSPAGRLLVSHMGLLFVPAGVGIIAEGDALRREGLPIIVAMIGSTLLSLAATGWLMHHLAAKNPRSGP
jgi:holin-like protein